MLSSRHSAREVAVDVDPGFWILAALPVAVVVLVFGDDRVARFAVCWP